MQDVSKIYPHHGGIMKKAVPVLIGVLIGVVLAPKLHSLPLVSKLPQF